MIDSLEKRRMFKNLVVLALPVILEELLTMFLQYVDMAMVGRLGAQATASVSLTTTVNWLIGSIFGAAGVAVVAIMSSAYGAGDREKIKNTAAQSVLCVLALGFTVFVICQVLSPYIPVWMQADPEIRSSASQYFSIISIPMVFRASEIICASAMRAVKDTKTPMMVNLGANILNVVLNWYLIYQRGLGVKGAAIATAIASVAAGVLMFVLMFGKKDLRFEFKDLRPDSMILSETAEIGLPALATSATSCLGHIVFASLVSSMGTTVFAAHSIALSAETVFYLPGYGLRSATSTLIGISVGQNNRESFRVVEKQSVVLTVAMMAFTGLLLFLFATPVMSIFTLDQEVIRQGSRVLRLIAVSEPLFGLMIVSEGILYGLGQTKTTFIVETIGAWGIRIVLTVICVKILHTTLFEVWMCMFADNAFRAFALSLPVFTGRDLDYFEKRLERSHLRKVASP